MQGHQETELQESLATRPRGFHNPFKMLSNNPLIARVFGSKAAGNQRISESLDYEPVQNKIYFDKMKEGKGEKKIYGYACLFEIGRKREALPWRSFIVH